MLVIEAHAKHGREFINDFSFGEKYQGYIDNNQMDEFHRQCGTHFIRGENSQSSVRILFRFTGVDQSLKTIFENTLETSAKANLKISDVGGGASLTTSNKISALFRIASKLVDIEGDVDATGGLGVETLLKIVKGFDYTNPDEGLKNIFEELANVASDFSRENASPVNFIVAPFPIPDSTTASFDADTFNALGEIYKALIRVDQILEQYNDYEKRNYDIWARYFRVRTEKIRSLRNKLVDSFKKCRREGDCDFDFPDEIEGVFLNDVIVAEVVQGLCSYGIVGSAVGLPDEGNLLSSVTVRVKGKMRFMEYTDLDAVEFLALGPDLEFTKLPVNFDEQFQLHENPEDQESKIAFIDMFTGHFPKDVYEIGGQLDQDRLLAERAKAAKSIYLARIPLTSGWVIEDVFGYPNMKGCSLRQQ